MSEFEYLSSLEKVLMDANIMVKAAEAVNSEIPIHPLEPREWDRRALLLERDHVFTRNRELLEEAKSFSLKCEIAYLIEQRRAEVMNHPNPESIIVRSQQR